jgi:hypothetical protein
MKFQMVLRTGHPDFLDLPWHVPLEDWRSDRLVDVPRGISRHVVRFLEYGDALYAVKELSQRLAEREYRLLAELAGLFIPVVEVVGLVVGRGTTDAGDSTATGGGELDAILITRYLDHSLPYTRVIGATGMEDLSDRLLDALTHLLVRLHVAGFFWGDCSLSNTLFRRDAGALAAYVVDTETSEVHPQLSDGQRSLDLRIAEENVAGELMDMAAGGMLRDIDPDAIASDLCRRYDNLWSELTREEVFGADQRFRVDERLRRLNALGFDVDEIQLVADGDGYRLRLAPRVVEAGHHARRLHALTGLQVQENQARRLLNDLARFRTEFEQRRGGPASEALVAFRWLSDVFEPTIASIPEELRGQLDPAELFHQVLDHRWYLSEAAGHDVGLADSVTSFVENVLRPRHAAEVRPNSTDGASTGAVSQEEDQCRDGVDR